MDETQVEKPPMTITDVLDFVDVVTTNTNNFLNAINDPNLSHTVLADQQNRKGISMFAMQASQGLIMEKIMEFLREKRSNILVTNFAPKPLITS